MKPGAVKLLAKTERAIQAAQTLLDAGDSEFAAGRAYYAMFYVAEALLFERDLTFNKHSAVQAAFGKEFAKTGELPPKFHQWLLDASDTRLEAEYAVEIAITEEDVEILLERAREFLQVAQRLLSREEPSGDLERS